MAKSRKLRFKVTSFPRSVQDVVSIDYSHKLSPEQKIWLAAFNESEHGANPEVLEELTGVPVTREQMREKWNEANHRRKDALHWMTDASKDELSPPVERRRNHEDVLIDLLDSRTLIQTRKTTKNRKK